MYCTHFGFDQSPFRITPDPAFFFPGGNRGAVLDALLYAITRGEGIVKVVGEVGSGKTMVALMSMLLAADNGYQACLMAPTELLSRQHYDTIQAMLGDLPIRCGLLTGQVKGKAEAAGCGLHHAQALGHHFFADAITGDDGDAVGLGHGGPRASRVW